MGSVEVVNAGSGTDSGAADRDADANAGEAGEVASADTGTASVSATVLNAKNQPPLSADTMVPTTCAMSSASACDTIVTLALGAVGALLQPAASTSGSSSIATRGDR